MGSSLLESLSGLLLYVRVADHFGDLEGILIWGFIQVLTLSCHCGICFEDELLVSKTPKEDPKFERFPRSRPWQSCCARNWGLGFSLRLQGLVQDPRSKEALHSTPTFGIPNRGTTHLELEALPP